MKILLIGSGGREHALAWRLARSPSCTELLAAPGNPGIAALARCVDVAAEDVDGLAALALSEAVDLVVVGPEGPLALGLADRLIAEGVAVFGPTRAAARLEASKAFTKEVADAAGAPTAAWARFDAAEPALTYLDAAVAPYVVKADGLAAGKGVVVTADLGEAKAAVRACFDGAFGAAGASVVIEEFLEGEEASLFALIDGETVVPLAGAQDHKRAFDGDKGPNTGGMGAYSPTPALAGGIDERAVEEILRPVAREMARRGTPYRGVLYAGLMVGREGPKLIEFNVRFGDPEAQAILPLIEGDFAGALHDVSQGRLKEGALTLSTRAAAVVVMAAGGYPGAYDKGAVITGVEDAEALEGVRVFHAGTKRDGDRLLTNGGRVLGVAAVADDAARAVEKAYEGVALISWAGARHRTDIGGRVTRGEAQT